jgi:hypothetical protein
MKISWNPVDGADEYEILRSSSIAGTYELISTISDTEYIDSALVLEIHIIIKSEPISLMILISAANTPPLKAGLSFQITFAVCVIKQL